MTIPLSRLIRARLIDLGLNVDELITRSELARSTVYSFLNDTRNPQGDSLRKLAAGLNWTAAELMARRDGTPLVSPVADEQIARIIELLPSIPKERLAAIEQHVTLAIQPTPRSASNRRSDGASNTRRGERRILDRRQRPNEETDSQGGLETVYPGRRHTMAAFSFTNILSNLKQWLEPSNPWPAAQPIQ